MQQSSAASLSNALRVYEDGAEAAILLLRGGDSETDEGFRAVFGAHDAPLARLESGVPQGAGTAGFCTIGDTSVVLAVGGAGASLLGMKLEVHWGDVSETWRSAARSTGCVWLGLMTESEYQRMLYADAVEAGDMRVFLPTLPEMPALRLEALFP